MIVSGRGRDRSVLLNRAAVGPYATRRFTGEYKRNGEPRRSAGDLVVESLYRARARARQRWSWPSSTSTRSTRPPGASCSLPCPGADAGRDGVVGRGRALPGGLARARLARGGCLSHQVVERQRVYLTVANRNESLSSQYSRYQHCRETWLCQPHAAAQRPCRRSILVTAGPAFSDKQFLYPRPILCAVVVCLRQP
jgi:hypothetical protein